MPARDAKTPGNIAPRADEGPEKSPILGRALACLTAHEPSSTVPLDEKARLKSLFPLLKASPPEPTLVIGRKGVLKINIRGLDVFVPSDGVKLDGGRLDMILTILPSNERPK